MCTLAAPMCVAADIPLPFIDEAIDRGVLYVVDHGGFIDGSRGCGMALVDLDNDGDADLVCTGAILTDSALFENDGTGRFTRKLDAGLPDLREASGVSAADYDGDGDLDLYFTTWWESDVLYRNDGELFFTDVTNEAGIGGSLGFGSGAAWGDYDGDGDLDLCVTNYSGIMNGDTTLNYLWRNNGDGTFTDVAVTSGIEPVWAARQATWFDYDVDGDLDLYLASRDVNQLFENVQGHFYNVSAQSGADVDIDAMGTAIGDVNGDGNLDIYCTNIPEGNPLLLNNGDGTFIDVARDAEVESFATGWGTHFFDFDNDADEDLYVCNTDNGVNRLYRNNRNFPMEELAMNCNVACYGDSYVLAVGDIDNDGDLDIAVQNQHQLIKVLINYEGEQRNWIKFDTKGVGMNKFAVGARLVATADGRLTVHEIAAGSNYKNTNDYIQHFGLDQDACLELLEIRFLDGATRTLTDAPANQTWTLLHPQLLGDTNADGNTDPIDLAAFGAAYGQVEFEQGWEVLDFTGDFQVSDEDILAFLDVYTGPIDDCDVDGTIDAIQIARGEAVDEDFDGVIDDCAPPCSGDVNDDGFIDGTDLAMVLGNWGRGGSDADVNDDGTVDGMDLAIVLGNWGSCSG